MQEKIKASEAIPVGSVRIKESCEINKFLKYFTPTNYLTISFENETQNLEYGKLHFIDKPVGDYNVTITPNNPFDFGAGKGKPLTTTLTSGELGIIIDLRPKLS